MIDETDVGDTISLPEAMEILGYSSHKSVYALEKSGKLTPRVNPFYKQKRWDLDEVTKLAKQRREGYKK